MRVRGDRNNSDKTAHHGDGDGGREVQARQGLKTNSPPLIVAICALFLFAVLKLNAW